MNYNKACEILEMERKYTLAMLKKAYHKAALKHHPDKGGDPEKFKQLKEAYEYLLTSGGDYKDIDLILKVRVI